MVTSQRFSRPRSCLGRAIRRQLLAVTVFLSISQLRGPASSFVLRRFVPSWILHAEADESRSVATQPALSKVGATIAEPFGYAEDLEQSLTPPKKATNSPWQMAQSSLQEMLAASEAQQLIANVSQTRDLAAAGAVLTLALASEAPLLKMATVAEDAIRMLSGLQLATVQDVLAAASSSSLAEGLPAFIASSLLLAAASTASQAALGEASQRSDWLQALNATAQEIWESGTGSLSSQAATLLKEVAKVFAAFDEQISTEAVDVPSAESSHGIALRCGSARRQGKDWILPIEVQLYRRNEGRHAMLLGMCRQLLFRSLHGVTESDFNADAEKLYEERARLIFRSLQLPSSDRALQRLEVRVGGPRDDDEGWHLLPPTDGQGLIQANVKFTDDDIPLADRFMEQAQVEVRLADADVAAQPQDVPRIVAPPSKAVATMVRPQGFGVISDIDDTVKVTEVFHGIKAVLQNTFLKSFDDVPGMAQQYRGWAQLGASFHYVSKSPPELHGPLSEFLNSKGFPVSSIHLCPLLGRDRANFKLRQVTSLLSQFPDRKFVLVGDSGEKDAEVYAEIMRSHPDQVIKVLIRAVDPKDRENTAKARAAFEGEDDEKWQVFADAADVKLETVSTFKWPSWLPWSKRPKDAEVEANLRGWPANAIPLAGVVVD